MIPLISLEGWNRVIQKQDAYFSNGNNGKNGIACPGCSNELIDRDQADSGQTDVYCDHCGYEGVRMV